MPSTLSFKMKMPGMKFVCLLMAAELLWSPVSSSISVLRLSNSTDYCTLANSHLSCDFTGVDEPVYAEEGYLENIDSVECRGPLVLHLPENACIKNMTIQHTKKVVVTGRSWKTSCNEYHLFVNNTTMTAIPLTTTHLHAVRSTCYKMTLHPKMKHVSIVSSRVSFLTTDQFLNDSVVVNITNTTVHYVNSLSASKNAKIQFLASDIAYMRLDRTALQDNAALVMVNSRIRAGDNQELLVPPGVSVILDRLDSKLEIRAIGIIPGSESSQSPESCNGISIKESTTQYFVQFVFFCASTVFLLLVVLFMCIKIMTTCLLKRSVRQIPDSVGHERQIRQNGNTLSEISLNELFESSGNFLNESFLHDHEKTAEADEKKELERPY
ncbi:uncharacterized protein LOC134788067 [Penaeus indicus]|uniref:uncharacterized protein LOC134788067 n=1 Tax=Penaeus indicus TaxID=29960 RepID=UPI00300CB8CC